MNALALFLLASATVPRFARPPSAISLEGPARPTAYLEASGRRAAFFGREDGSFEAWVYPMKILRGFELAFEIEDYASPIPGASLASRVDVQPEASTIRYTHSSFTADANLVLVWRMAGSRELAVRAALGAGRHPCGLLRQDGILTTAGSAAAQVPSVVTGCLCRAPSGRSIRALAICAGRSRSSRVDVRPPGDGLVFGGTVDGYFFALDAESGRELWHVAVGARVHSAPITYAVNGQQLVTIAAGNVVFTFGLD